MKIYIVGTGGVGGYFGGVLAKAGLDVTFVARGDSYEAIKQNGIVIKSVAGDFNVNPAKVVNKISDIKNPDLIIISVKTYDTEIVAKELSTVINQNTIILTFQNGVENDVQFKKIANEAQVYPGVAYVIASKTKPGVIEQTGGLRNLIFGDRNNPDNDKLKEIEKVFREAGIDAVLSDDITRDVWKKFIFICAFSGMTALYRKPIGEILSDPIRRKQYEDCLKESIDIAKAKGVNITENAFDETMKISENTTPNSKSSLLVDIENKRRNEIQTLNGKLVALAEDLDIAVPINKLICDSIKSSLI